MNLMPSKNDLEMKTKVNIRNCQLAELIHSCSTQQAQVALRKHHYPVSPLTVGGVSVVLL